jgi:choline dehydrogenase-like flavoprotein
VSASPVPGLVPWSEPDLAILAAVFDTLVPGDDDRGMRRARLAAETISATTDPGEVRLLRLALRSLGWPIANLLLTGRWGRFSRVAHADRERILLRWATHPLARLRTAYQVVSRLGKFLAYADAGDDPEAPENRHWQRIGYRLPEPAEAPPERVQPLAVDREGSAPLVLDADAVVVGSGAGGGVIAARLAAAGRSVLVVEAGIHLPEREMRGLEGPAFRDLYLDRGTTATSDLSIMILAGGALGGGTTINWTTSIEPPPALRSRWATEHGLEGFDGAQTDTDLARLRDELGLRAPTVIPAKDQALLDGAATLGWEAAPTERNAGPCTDCGACGFGCRRGAKRGATVAHLASAARDGARILVEAPVEAVSVRNGRAVGVVGWLRVDGVAVRPFEIHAPVVVMAAGALRTPLVLEASGISHLALGRNLHLHPTVAVVGEFETPVEAWAGPTQAARSLQFLSGGPAAADHPGPAHRGFVIESAPAHPGLIASALPWEGGQAAMDWMGRARHLAPLIGLLSEAGSGRVAQGPRGYPRITYQLAPADAGTARRALIEMSRMSRAAGARQVTALGTPPARWAADDGAGSFDRYLSRVSRVSTAANRISLFSAHQLGSARAGGDPRTAPVDPEGGVRRDAGGSPVGGLYVGDGSLFPTASVVNPMLTVMALAERTARTILADTTR